MDLIKIEQRELTAGVMVDTVEARALWECMDVKDKFTDWIFSRLDKYGFVAEEDYLLRKIPKQVPHEGGVRNIVSVEYYLTIDTAKEIAMVQNNDKGREVRKYFIECERRAKAAAAASAHRPPAAPSFDMENFEDPEFILPLLTKYAEQNRALKATIAEQTPQVDALNRIATITQGSLCIRDAAKVLQIRERLLFQWLEAHDWIYRRSGTNYIAYSPRIKQGFLEHKLYTAQARNTEDKIVSQVRVTPKGMTYLAKMLSKPLVPATSPTK